MVEPSFAHPLWQYLVFSYCFAVLFVLLWAFYRANSLKIDPVFLASLTPLALYLFGIDYGRWVAIEFFLLTCTVMVQVTYFGCELPRLKKTLLVAALIFCVPLGPMGSVGAFTYLPFRECPLTHLDMPATPERIWRGSRGEQPLSIGATF